MEYSTGHLCETIDCIQQQRNGAPAGGSSWVKRGGVVFFEIEGINSCWYVGKKEKQKNDDVEERKIAG